jgi:hypothetical protein
MRGLISIIDTPHTITITSNTFMFNSAVKGLIYITSDARTNTIVIADNNFTQNAAYYGGAAIYIRASAATGVYLNQIDTTGGTTINTEDDI